MLDWPYISQWDLARIMRMGRGRGRKAKPPRIKKRRAFVPDKWRGENEPIWLGFCLQVSRPGIKRKFVSANLSLFSLWSAVVNYLWKERRADGGEQRRKSYQVSHVRFGYGLECGCRSHINFDALPRRTYLFRTLKRLIIHPLLCVCLPFECRLSIIMS
jgi:hypothetical protein